MKRFSSLTAAASLAGLVMVSSGPALAFDSDAIPPMLVASPTLPLSACLYAEKAGYPNPGGDGCSYLDVGPPYYYNMWNPENSYVRPECGDWPDGDEVLDRSDGLQTAPRIICRQWLLLQDRGRPRAGYRDTMISPVKPRPEGSPAVVFLTFQMELPLILLPASSPICSALPGPSPPLVFSHSFPAHWLRSSCVDRYDHELLRALGSPDR